MPYVVDKDIYAKYTPQVYIYMHCTISYIIFKRLQGVDHFLLIGFYTVFEKPLALGLFSHIKGTFSDIHLVSNYIH